MSPGQTSQRERELERRREEMPTPLLVSEKMPLAFLADTRASTHASAHNRVPVRGVGRE